MRANFSTKRVQLLYYICLICKILRPIIITDPQHRRIKMALKARITLQSLLKTVIFTSINLKANFLIKQNSKLKWKIHVFYTETTFVLVRLITNDGRKSTWQKWATAFNSKLRTKVTESFLENVCSFFRDSCKQQPLTTYLIFGRREIAKSRKLVRIQSNDIVLSNI